MKNLAVFIFVAVLFAACEKEQPLTPNLEVAQISPQTAGGGSNGGSNSSGEYFDFNIDRAASSNSDPFYQFQDLTGTTSITSNLSGSPFMSLTGVIDSIPDTITVNDLFFSVSYTIPNISQPTLSQTYIAETGSVIFTANSSTKVEGTFNSILLRNAQDTNDSLMASDGRFSVNK